MRVDARRSLLTATGCKRRQGQCRHSVMAGLVKLRAARSARRGGSLVSAPLAALTLHRLLTLYRLKFQQQGRQGQQGRQQGRQGQCRHSDTSRGDRVSADIRTRAQGRQGQCRHSDTCGRQGERAQGESVKISIMLRWMHLTSRPRIANE